MKPEPPRVTIACVYLIVLLALERAHPSSDSNSRLDVHFPDANKTGSLELDLSRMSIESSVRMFCRDWPCAEPSVQTELVAACRRYVKERARIAYQVESFAEAWPWVHELQQAESTGRLSAGSWLAHADITTRQQTTQRLREIEGIIAGELGVWRKDCLDPSSLQRTVGACPLHSALVALSTHATTNMTAVERAPPPEPPWLEGHSYGDDRAPVVVVHVEGPPATWKAAAAALVQEGQVEHARAAYTRALSQSPLNDSERLGLEASLATVMAVEGLLEHANSLYAAVLASEGEDSAIDGKTGMVQRFRAMTLIPPIIPSKEEVEVLRERMASDLRALLAEDHLPEIRDPLDELGGTLFHLAHQGLNDRSLQELVGRVLMRLSPSLVAGDPPLPPQQPPTDRPLSVGFLSNHLYDHSIGRMMVQLLHMLAQSPRLRITVLTSGEPRQGDRVEEFLADHVHHFVRLPFDLTAARGVVAAQALDVLIYPDLGMEPFSFYLSFARLAPVQMTWWGHPVTTGLPSIDYFLSLEDEVEDAQAHYSEQLIRMTYVNAPDLLLESHASHEPWPPELDLPQDANLYMVLGRLFKVHPDFDDIMWDLLNRDSRAVIVLVHEKLQESWTKLLWERLKYAADARGVGGLLSRIRFVHPWNYFKTLKRAAAVLDTYPYGGCLSTLDALAHAVPVISLPSQFVRGRFTLALYRQMGVMDCVASTPSEFVDLALRCGHDVTFRASIVDKLLARHDEITQHEATAAEWEAMLLRVGRSMDLIV